MSNQPQKYKKICAANYFTRFLLSILQIFKFLLIYIKLFSPSKCLQPLIYIKDYLQNILNCFVFIKAYINFVTTLKRCRHVD